MAATDFYITTMKKTILIILLITGNIFSLLYAQTDRLRIAVFDPSGIGNNVDEGLIAATREIISSVLVNTGKYNIVERSLLDKILTEQKFSNSGAVDASQISELGRLVGANKAILTVLTATGKRIVLSIKMVDIKSANVENQKTQVVASDEILDIVEPLTLEMIGETVPKSESNSKTGSLFGGKGNTKKLSDVVQEEKKQSNEYKSDKERFAEQNEEEVFSISDSIEEREAILFKFKGAKNRKNPTVQLFLDDQKIGDGTLYQGFDIRIKDLNPGNHKLRIEWSGTIANSSLVINTNVKKSYIFTYGTTGFGYALKLVE